MCSSDLRANALSAAALKYGGQHIEAGMTTWELDKLPIVKKQEMTERVKRHPPAYRRKLNMAKRKNQKRRSKKYQVNNRQLKAKRMSL